MTVGVGDYPLSKVWVASGTTYWNISNSTAGVNDLIVLPTNHTGTYAVTPCVNDTQNVQVCSASQPLIILATSPQVDVISGNYFSAFWNFWTQTVPGGLGGA
jgi:hypothetical protein